MNTTHTATPAARIHPLVALAAGSVVLVGLAGTAAITGLLPNSKATVAAPVAAQVEPMAAPAAVQAPVQAVPVVQQYALVPVQPAPVVVQAAPAPAPVVKKVVHHARPIQRNTPQVARYDDREDNRARYDDRSYSEPVRVAQPQPQPQRVNYVGVGAGALIGGLVGNQIGGGNGKKLATVAGLIGGGMLGNEIANRNQYGR